MRCSEGAYRHQGNVLAQLSRYGINLRCLQAFPKREGRKDTGKSLGHHRFATTRSSNHQQVVSTCSRNFEGTLDALLTFDLSEIKAFTLYPSIKLPSSIDLNDGKRCFACEHPDDFAQGTCGVYVEVVHDSGFSRISLRKDKASIAFAPCLYRYRECSVNRAYGSIQG